MPSAEQVGDHARQHQRRIHAPAAARVPQRHVHHRPEQEEADERARAVARRAGAGSSHAVPSAPALITEPARRRGASAQAQHHRQRRQHDRVSRNAQPQLHYPDGRRGGGAARQQQQQFERGDAAAGPRQRRKAGRRCEPVVNDEPVVDHRSFRGVSDRSWGRS